MVILPLFYIIQIDLYTGGIFIQQALGWNIYGGVLFVLGISAVYTVLGEEAFKRAIMIFYTLLTKS